MNEEFDPAWFQLLPHPGRKIGTQFVGWDAIQEQEYGPEDPLAEHPYRRKPMTQRYESLNLYPK